jgi:predicted GIY-YIG superfamily endonuclease
LKVYLIHFKQPLHHAQHYIGKARLLAARLKRHRSSQGARILQVCNDRGITYDIVRTWDEKEETASKLERRLKNMKHAWKFCPVCNPLSWNNCGKN